MWDLDMEYGIKAGQTSGVPRITYVLQVQLISLALLINQVILDRASQAAEGPARTSP